jgi:hypothetical protein
MMRRPEECVFTPKRTCDRGRLGDPVDVKGCARADSMTINQPHESLVPQVGGLIYVQAIARCIMRCRVLGQGITPTV